MAHRPSRVRALLGWAAWIAALALLTAAMVAVRTRLDRAHVALGYLLLLVASSTRGTRERALGLAVLAFLCFNFFFLPPFGTLTVHDPLDWLVLVTFLTVSAVSTQLLYRARNEADEARSRAAELEKLSRLGAESLNAVHAEEALAAVAQVIRAQLGVERCEVWLRTAPEGPLVLAASAPPAPAGVATPDAAALVERATQGGHPVIEDAAGAVQRVALAERRTDLELDALPPARAIAIPLRVRDHTVGVLRLQASGLIRLSPAERRFFAVLAYYAATGAERVRLSAEEAHAEALRAAARMKDALLASVSHDLRTPLTTIKALAHDLREAGDERAVIIEEEADRLNRFVADLLDLSRLNAGELPVELEIVAAEDLVGAALQRVSGSMHDREIRVELHPEHPLLLGWMDFVHALRVVVNLLENADKYAPRGTPIEVRVSRTGEQLQLRIADHGPGVSEAEQARIFEPFYRDPQAQEKAGGAGLGLSIARRLAAAQGGSLSYEPRPRGGSVFVFSLPAAELPADETALAPG